MEFLGHVVSAEGLRPCPSKVEAIQAIRVPKTPKEVRGFLGMCGWYRRFIKDYSTLAAPMQELTKDVNKARVPELMKTPQCMASFNGLKEALVGEDVMLIHPDHSKMFRVDLDASLEQIGGVLQQEVDGHWKPIEYLSKKLSHSVLDDHNAPTHLEALHGTHGVCETMATVPAGQEISTSHGSCGSEVAAHACV